MFIKSIVSKAKKIQQQGHTHICASLFAVLKLALPTYLQISRTRKPLPLGLG